MAGRKFLVEVVDSCKDYVELMKEIFDFGQIRELVAGGKNMKVLINSLHGVTGPYVEKIFCEELGCPKVGLPYCNCIV